MSERQLSWGSADPEPTEDVGPLTDGDFTWRKVGRSWQTREGGVLPWPDLVRHRTLRRAYEPDSTQDLADRIDIYLEQGWSMPYEARRLLSLASLKLRGDEA